MKANQNTEEQSWELLARNLYDNSEVTEDQIQIARNAVLPTEKDKEQFDNLTQKVDLYFELKKFSSENAWNRMQEQNSKPYSTIQSNGKLAFLKPWFRIAAAILVGAFLMLAGYEVVTKSASKTEWLVKSTDKESLRLVLSDGSIVSLNSHSKISYPEKFVGSRREIAIEGEAFFEVSPDKTKPFVIRAGKAQIKVLGTSFNVNAYPDKQQVEVIVQTGRVQLAQRPEKNVPTDALILNPGDRGICDCKSNSLQKSINQNINFNSWKTHVLIFKATSLNEVIQVLEKVYNVKIDIENPKLGQRLFTTQFNNDSLEFILKVIEEAFQLKVSKINDQYILKSRS